jgi:hypothetical protein
MRHVSTGCNNATAQDFGDNLGGLASAVDAVIGKLIGRETLRVKSTKAGFVAEKRPAGHSHTARKENLDGRVQPQNGSTGSAQKIGAPRLRVSAAAERENGAFFQLPSATERSAKLIRLDLAKCEFAEAFKDLWNGEAGGSFDTVIKIDKMPGEVLSEERANGGFPGTHKTGQAQNRDAGLRPAQRR